MRPTDQEKAALIAYYEKSSEKNRKFIMSCLEEFASENQAAQPKLRLIIGGARIKRKEAAS